MSRKHWANAGDKCYNNRRSKAARHVADRVERATETKVRQSAKKIIADATMNGSYTNIGE
jgi:hypothetical protein